MHDLERIKIDLDSIAGQDCKRAEYRPAFLAAVQHLRVALDDGAGDVARSLLVTARNLLAGRDKVPRGRYPRV